MKNTYKVNEEAVKKIAERVYDNGSTVINRNDLEEMFPAFKENEDERMVKFIKQQLFNIKKTITDNYKLDTELTKAIDWLEKQCKQKPNYCHHEVNLSNCSEEYRKAYYDGWNNCNMQHSQCRSELDDVVKCLINGMKFYYEDNEEATWGTDKWSMPVKHIIEVLEKQGEQKIEPKFKVGDWIITNKKHIWYVDETPETTSYLYRLINQYGKVEVAEFEVVDKEAKLWTIQDAKDGDVLTTDTWTFIFKKYQDKFVCYHCAASAFNNFSISDTGEFDSNYVHPATKEQRDLLFIKMKEAGYEWDAEKKELKKIEQKSDNWEPQTGDTFRKKGTTSPTYHLCNKREDGITFGFVENREVGISGGEITILALRQDYELVKRPKSVEDIIEEELNRVLQTKVEQNLTWSEEDENTIKVLISIIKKSEMIDPLIYTNSLKEKLYNWFEFLKVRMQPKQEWSEEDDMVLNSILDSIQREGVLEKKRKTDWLKSLKPQNVYPQSHWKPSEKQMKALEHAINCYAGISPTNNREVYALEIMKEQLKKIREG